MTKTFVLRLLTGPADDELHGEIEEVLDGERTVVRSGDELLNYLREALGLTTDA